MGRKKDFIFLIFGVPLHPKEQRGSATADHPTPLARKNYSDECKAAVTSRSSGFLFGFHHFESFTCFVNGKITFHPPEVFTHFHFCLQSLKCDTLPPQTFKLWQFNHLAYLFPKCPHHIFFFLKKKKSIKKQKYDGGG